MFATVRDRDAQDALSDDLDRAPRPSRGQIEEAAKAHKTLVATMPSTCFDSLTWRDGVATAVFAKDGSVYDYPMDVDDFLDWANSGSLGKTFNDEIR